MLFAAVITGLSVGGVKLYNRFFTGTGESTAVTERLKAIEIPDWIDEQIIYKHYCQA